MTTTSVNITASTSMTTAEFPGADQAFAELKPVLAAIPATEVRTQRVMVAQAVANMMAMAGAFTEDRALFASTFKPEAFNPDHFDNLPQRALALYFAEKQWFLVVDPEKALPGLVDQGAPLRQKFSDAGRYLWSRDPVIAPQMARLRANRGFLDLADDLAGWAALFDANWLHASTRCDVKQEDIKVARSVSTSMLVALGSKGKPEKESEWRSWRDRAATYARQGVDEVLSAAEYVHRKNPDALERYPSFFFLPPKNRKQAADTTDSTTNQEG